MPASRSGADLFVLSELCLIDMGICLRCLFTIADAVHAIREGKAFS